MIYTYGFSVTGKSHLKNNTCCQDAHKILELDNGWVIAAVADGVGSAKNSSIGSSIAVNNVVDFCAEYMPWDYSLIGIKSMLRTAYNHAFKQIIREAEKAGEPIESYDTTLTTVIYDGHRIIYGHSGDGAIIGLTPFGDYIQITTPQKGEDNVSVIPLRAGYTVWAIDSCEEELAAVILLTDGLLDYAFCPYPLRLSNDGNVYIPIASFFADPYRIPANPKEWDNDHAEIQEFLTADRNYNPNKFYNRLEEIYEKHLGREAKDVIDLLRKTNYANTLMQSVEDDKTIVTLINKDSIVDTKVKKYYSEPNWHELQEAWNKKAYPHLYIEKEEIHREEDSVENELDTKAGDKESTITKENNTGDDSQQNELDSSSNQATDEGSVISDNQFESSIQTKAPLNRKKKKRLFFKKTSDQPADN